MSGTTSSSTGSDRGTRSTTPPPGADRRGTPRSVAALGAAAGAAIAVVVGGVSGMGAASVATVGSMALVAALFTAMGALVLLRRPRHRVGILMTLSGLVATVAVIADSWSAWLPFAWIGQWAWWPAFGLIFFALLFFPDGNLPSPGWRPLAVVIVFLTVGVTLALAVAALDHPRTLATDLTPEFTPRAQVLVRLAVIGGGLMLLALVGVLFSLVRRWRSTRDDRERRQLACLIPGSFVLVVGVLLDVAGVEGAWAIAALAVPVAMTVAVLRYELWDLHEVIHRTVVWAGMTFLVVVGFGVLVTALGGVVTDDASTASLVATGLIVVAFDPLRRRLQRRVDWLVYGDRGEPTIVMERLGEVTGGSGGPADVLRLLCMTVVESLRVPFVAVELDDGGTVRRVAEFGRADAEPVEIEMTAHGNRVGSLLVAPRRQRERFTPEEKRLLANAAVHAAVAGGRIMELQQARERLVEVREDEQRRLRRDLHDDVGPGLAGLAMQLRAARRAAGGDAGMADRLSDIEEDLKQCAAAVRELVDRLRPPELDPGLGVALRQKLAKLGDSETTITLDADEVRLTGLSVAVEVAAYRIVMEAVTNVLKHAGAKACTVTVTVGDVLSARVEDDGTGIRPSGRKPGAVAGGGVGLDSMRERCEELGGRFDVRPRDGGGTVVEFVLPLRSLPGEDPPTAAAADGSD